MVEGVFLWPRRKALADGGGRGITSWGGVDDFLGGDELREELHGLGLISLGGDTCRVGVSRLGGELVKLLGVGGGGECDKSAVS